MTWTISLSVYQSLGTKFLLMFQYSLILSLQNIHLFLFLLQFPFSTTSLVSAGTEFIPERIFDSGTSYCLQACVTIDSAVLRVHCCGLGHGSRLRFDTRRPTWSTTSPLLMCLNTLMASWWLSPCSALLFTAKISSPGTYQFELLELVKCQT